MRGDRGSPPLGLLVFFLLISHFSHIDDIIIVIMITIIIIIIIDSLSNNHNALTLVSSRLVRWGRWQEGSWISL